MAEIAAGIWGCLNKETLAAHVKNAMKLTVEEEYAKVENRKLLFDAFQRKVSFTIVIDVGINVNCLFVFLHV